MSKKLSSDKITGNSEGAILATLWLKVLEETNLINAVEPLIDRYVNKSNSMKSVKRKTKSSLTKNIHSKDMTWKIFLDLMFNFINVKRIDFSIKITFANAETRVITLPVNHNDIEEERDEDKDTTSAE